MGKHSHRLRHEARQCFGKIRKGASLTREKHLGNLDRIADFAAKRGLQHIDNINTRFVKAFVEHLKESGLKAATVEGYLSTLRRLAHQVGKNNIVAKENKEYGIVRRGGDRYAPKEANMEKIADIKQAILDKYGADKSWILVAATLREAFGLRAKESLLSNKITENAAGETRFTIEKGGKGNKNNVLEIKGGKGGRLRSNESEVEKQHEALSMLRAYQKETGRESIIPENLTLKQALKQQSNIWHRMGGTKEARANTHVTRHAEVQRMISEGKNPQEVIERVGHGDTRKLSHYVHR